VGNGGLGLGRTEGQPSLRRMCRAVILGRGVESVKREVWLLIRCLVALRSSEAWVSGSLCSDRVCASAQSSTIEVSLPRLCELWEGTLADLRA
jgi:hypothetical protein